MNKSNIPKKKLKRKYKKNRNWDNRRMPVGTLSKWSDGMYRVKTEDGRWIYAHHDVWIKNAGTFDVKKFHVVFKDKNPENLEFSNLEKVPVKAKVGKTRKITGGYQVVKVNEDEWKLKHHAIWEAAHGPIDTSKYLIRFKDGDVSNVELSNLKLVTRKDHVAANSIGRFPPELRRTIMALSRYKMELKKE